MKKLVFVAALKSGSAATVTHNTVAANNEKMASGLQQIYSGMEQMVVGFFTTWTAFMRSPPLPAVDDNYQLEDQGGQWRLSYKEGTTGIVTIMQKDFSVREMTVDATDFLSKMQPTFTRSNEGFLLSGYNADYRNKSSNNRDVTLLQVLIAYQKVNGLQLPKKVNIAGSQNGQPFQVEVAFSGCTATKH